MYPQNTKILKNSLTIKRTITLLILTLVFYSAGQHLNSVSAKHKESKAICTSDISFTSDNTDDIPYFIEEDSEENDKDLHRFPSADFYENRIFYITTLSEFKNNDNLPVVILVQNTNLPPPSHS